MSTMDMKTEFDMVQIRQEVRTMAKSFGMGLVDQTRITTAASEVLRNMFIYAGGGEVTVLKARTVDGMDSLLVRCVDKGPGIEDVELAMQDGYSTVNSMGFGLPGAKRLVDRFDILSVPGQGTTVEMVKFI
jgi:serine/threonine-protein kinase RsbT